MGCLLFSSCTASPYAPAHRRRYQRATRVSILPQDILLLLFLETTLPRQARAVRHAVRVRVLPPEVPDEELADHAQEPAAPRLQRHAEAAAEDVGAALGAGAQPAPPVRPGRRPWPAVAARPPMTTDHGLDRSQDALFRVHRASRPGVPVTRLDGRAYDMNSIMCNITDNAKTMQDLLRIYG